MNYPRYMLATHTLTGLLIINEDLETINYGSNSMKFTLGLLP